MSWFIPPEFDDGFTRRHEKFLFRPMLWEHRQMLKRAVEAGEAQPTDAISVPWLVPTSILDRLLDWQTESGLAVLAKQILSYSSEQEAKDFLELRHGFTLLAEKPFMATMSCDICKEYIVDIDTGMLHFAAGSKVPSVRAAAIPTPCDSGRTCPRGHWSEPKGFTKLCESVWKHYWFMKAAGKPAPDCPIIHRNWALIEWIIRGRDPKLNPMAAGTDR